MELKKRAIKKYLLDKFLDLRTIGPFWSILIDLSEYSAAQKIETETMDTLRKPKSNSNAFSSTPKTAFNAGR